MKQQQSNLDWNAAKALGQDLVWHPGVHSNPDSLNEGK
jgi:hypothetical protein